MAAVRCCVVLIVAPLAIVAVGLSHGASYSGAGSCHTNMKSEASIAAPFMKVMTSWEVPPL
jgi:hypothetical protein